MLWLEDIHLGEGHRTSFKEASQRTLGRLTKAAVLMCEESEVRRVHTKCSGWAHALSELKSRVACGVL